jgi:hypothetical protein
MTALVTFRDWDLCYKPPLYREVNWTEYNKTGYVSKSGWVIYPYGRSVRSQPLERITKKRHTMVPLNFMANLDDIDKYFTHNRPSAELFFRGLLALTKRDQTYFDFPVRLPILPPTTPQEFEERWQRMEKIVRPADCIMTFDTTSYISKIIAAVDRGVWSHVAGYAGDGNVFEMTASGLLERPLNTYRSPKYRIGLYRPATSTGDPNDPRIGVFLAWSRARIGRLGYDYPAVAKIGLRKLLGIQQRKPNDLEVTPNDMARSEQLRLLFTI